MTRTITLLDRIRPVISMLRDLITRRRIACLGISSLVLVAFAHLADVDVQ